MPINNIFGFINLSAKSLDLRDERQGLIQSNIANIETPGYKAQDFPFQKVMESVMGNVGNLDRTHPGHMALDPVTTSEGFALKSGNRPVDLDEEMLKLSENQFMYQVTARIVTKKLEGLRFIIDEGGK